MENIASIVNGDQLKLINKFVKCKVLACNLRCDNCCVAMGIVKNQIKIDGYCFECNMCLSRKSIRSSSWLFKSKLTLSQHLIFINLWVDNIDLCIISKQVSISPK